MSEHSTMADNHASLQVGRLLKINPIGDITETRAFVFSFDDTYAKYFSVALASLVNNIDINRCYDIVILHNCVTEQNMSRIAAMAPKNFSLRFFDVGELACKVFGDLEAKVHSNQWDVSTFYDLLIPLIMPEYGRVLYCDSDLVFCKDPDELFRMPLDGMQLIAVRDSLMLASQVAPENPFLRDQIGFLASSMGVRSLDGYFNGGVLLFDVPSIDARDYHAQVAKTLNLPKLPTLDQDVLNYVFKDRAKVAPQCFNVQAHVMDFKSEGAPSAEKFEYLDAINSPTIVHYTTYPKPWSNVGCPLGALFWHYAKLSPFFEDIVKGNHLEEQREALSGFNLRLFVKCAILSKLALGRQRENHKQSLEIQRGFLATKRIRR